MEDACVRCADGSDRFFCRCGLPRDYPLGRRGPRMGLPARRLAPRRPSRIRRRIHPEVPQRTHSVDPLSRMTNDRSLLLCTVAIWLLPWSDAATQREIPAAATSIADAIASTSTRAVAV